MIVKKRRAADVARAMVLLSASVCIGLLSAAPAKAETFAQINSDGFGDRANSYAWSMARFQSGGKDCLYVGSNRHFADYVFDSYFPVSLPFPVTRPPGEIGDKDWAEAMRAEIWRFDGSAWQRVYQSDVTVSKGRYYPNETGLRQMVVYNGQLYATSGLGLVPGRLVIKSATGDPGDWQHVPTPLAMGSDSRAMTVHNGKLYVAPSGLGGTATLWRMETDGEGDSAQWELVVDLTDAGPGRNQGIWSLKSFGGRLYVGTENMEAGFQVWRSTSAEPGPGDWKLVVPYGGGDIYNLSAATMEVFKDRLYVATIFLPIGGDSVSDVRVPKGFEMIRIDRYDRWELIVGDCIPRSRPPGGSWFRFPKSGRSAGFGNILNFYGWSLVVHDGSLYLGTFDANPFLYYLLGGGVADASALPAGAGQAADGCFGADLWKSEGGTDWRPVFLDGLGDLNNYGIRTMQSDDGLLYLGTANPFTGAEVWVGR